MIDDGRSSTSTAKNAEETRIYSVIPINDISQSEKIIVPTESSRPVETAPVPKDSAYKRFARNLCGGRHRRRTTNNVSKKASANIAAVTATDISVSGKANGRWQKYWPATVWKRRPRLCCQCGAKKPKVPAIVERPVSTVNKDVRRHQRWPQWLSCKNCFCKRKKKSTVSRMSSSSISVGALGIAPPTTNTFCEKLKQRMYCNCLGRCAMPNFVRRLCYCCYRRGGNADKSNPPKKKSAIRRRSLFKCTGCCTNIPKLDAVFVDHTSVMKGAIPVLPLSLAWLCLVFNVIIPGAGTFSSGMLCLCFGKPRFTVNDNFQSRLGSFCVNFIVAAAQLFTVLFCLVGWGWSIWWGMIILKMAKKYQKIKIVDQSNEAPPSSIDNNHQV